MLGYFEGYTMLPTVRKLCPLVLAGLLFVSNTLLLASIPSPERVLVGHVQVLQSLKERAELNAPKAHPKYILKTPTLSYLNAVKKGYLNPYYDHNWYWYPANYGNAAYYDICILNGECPVDAIIEAEKRYFNDYYVFYHGQKSQFWMLQEFLKELYTLIKIHSPLREFEFLRAWHEAVATYQVNNFIDTHEPKLPKDAATQTAIWDDTTPAMIKNMLCVNLSIFGNFTYQGESSFEYFINNSNASFVAVENILSKLFDHFGFDKSYIAQLSAQNKLFSHKNGLLLQIFVPKNKVDQYVYLSEAWGIPYRKKLDATWNPHKKRHLKISTLLEKYIKEPHLMGNFDQLQARILMSQDCLLNPDSGVKIFKYSTENQENIVAYMQIIKNIAKEVFITALEKKKLKNILNTPLARLMKYSKIAATNNK